MSEGTSILHKLRRGEIYFDATLLYSTLLNSTLFMKWESIGLKMRQQKSHLSMAANTTQYIQEAKLPKQTVEK